MTEEKFDRHAHASTMREQEFWKDITVEDILSQAVNNHPNKTALVSYRSEAGSTSPVKSLTYSELENLVAKTAGSLKGLGIKKGDIVALMLPNWWEFVVATYALSRLGAVTNPLMPIFRERELRFMLSFSETKAIIIPNEFRGFSYQPMLEALRPELPALEHVIVVDGGDNNGFEQTILNSSAEPVSAEQATSSDADELSVLMYTSGTTGQPKGVMHTWNTMLTCASSLATRLELTSEDVHMVSAPFGHTTGYTAGILQSLLLGGKAVLQDVWKPENGVNIMASEGVTHMAASTPFLSDICRVVSDGNIKPSLKTFLCGGAPIPPVIIEDAFKLLNAKVCSLWGMTEALAGSLTEPEKAMDKSSTTDGRALRGIDLLVADDNHTPLEPGQTGRLFVRGANLFLGYYKRPDLENIHPDGWFDTGDMAYMDEDGYIRINGRTKDIIIRGAENIPVAEIEDVLYRHPSITDAALVGYADHRLGERACAFVTLKPGTQFDISDLQTWMEKSGTTKQYWPEQVEVLDIMPRNPSGKIQKFMLKELAEKYVVN